MAGTTSPRGEAVRIVGVLGLGGMLAAGVVAGCSDVDTNALMRDRNTPEEGAVENVPTCAATEESPLRRLTRIEVRNTLADVFGVEPPALTDLPDDGDTGRFRNTIGQSLTAALVEKYLDVAAGISERALAGKKIACTGDENACIGAFVDDKGARLFRRPLTAEEKAHYVDLFTRTRGSSSFDEAVTTLVSALVVAPQFLFHLEPRREGTPEGQPYVLDDFQLAARLSYTFWHTTPDRELTDLARAGKLRDASVVAAQAERLMNDERAKDTVRDFLAQWLELDRVGSLVVDQAKAPEYTPALVADLARESQALAEHAFWSTDDTLKGLLASGTRFRSQRLSAFYGDDLGKTENVTATTASPDAKSFGLFSQAGFMATISRNPNRQIIYRGRFLRERFLCGKLSPPGASLPVAPLPDVHPGTTTRQQVTDHTAASTCNGCHSQMNPLGYALENFDALGRWRDKEEGLPIDATSEIKEVGAVNGAFELAQKLAESAEVRSCMARQIFEYTLARNPGTSDACALGALEAAPSRKFRDLFVSIASNPAFFSRKEPTP
jgi:hypothetical protein